MQKTTTTTYITKPEWNCLHQTNNYYCVEVKSDIREGLVKRLIKYAKEALIEDGFDILNWPEINVSTTDGNDIPSNRSYCVKFINDKKGSIGVQGIFCRNGWPFLDHGFFIERA